MDELKERIERFLPKQKESSIFYLACTGLSGKEIGSILNITEGTVKWRLNRIFKRYSVKNKIEMLKKILGYESLNHEKFTDKTSKPEILQMMADGKKIKEIAEEMNRAIGSVKFHLTEMRKETSTKSNVHLIVHCWEKMPRPKSNQGLPIGVGG